ncbi:MAG: VOC family protein [Ignavibacteriales bacterium]|nr:VOC family protein [Ignavibacteriales bacterium]
MQKITPFLWFDNNAEEAVEFYTSIFKNSKGGDVSHYEEQGAEVSGRPKGSVMTVPFQLNGQDFVALNGGPLFKFTEAVSFVVNCETQEEVDYFWEKLTEGGGEAQCGWLKDKFGLSWQVVPTAMGKLFSSPDPEKTNRVMKAMLQMKKLVIADLQKAYDGK